MFKSLTIQTRLVFLISFLSAELILGAVIGLVSLAHTNDTMQAMYDDQLVCLGQLDRIARAIDVNQFNVAKLVSADAGAAAGLLDEVERNRKLVGEQWTAYTATRMDAEEKQLAARFDAARTRFVGEALDPALAALRANDKEAAAKLLHGPMTALFQPLREALDALVANQLAEAKGLDQQSHDSYQLVRLLCLAGLALGLLLAAVVGTVLVRGIVQPLKFAVRVAGGVAAGDLTQRIEARTGDETGRLMRALKEMNDGLAKIVGRVRAGTDTIATASGQIAAGNLDLSSRTEQQAASLEETASSMEELTATVKQNADNARQANALAQSASEVAGKGGEVVTQVVATMRAIDSSATRIADIIGVIDGIAFQTNILALNAAVEAARAGEQGRGFAVVAGEVRSLAQRSAAAAKEIKALIDDSVDKVHHGSALVDQAGATMGEIVQSVNRVTDIMAEIMAASQEQTAGIEQVNRAIAQMDQATQQNAALVEQASAAAQALRGEADSLAQAVGTFWVDAQPAGRAAPAAKAVARTSRPAVTASQDWETF